MEARQAQEGGQSSQNELCDVDKDTPMDPIPTRTEALCTAKTLRHYTRDKDNPFPRQLDLTLGTFGQQTITLITLKMNNMEDIKRMSSKDKVQINSRVGCFVRHMSHFYYLPENPYTPITHTSRLLPRGYGL